MGKHKIQNIYKFKQKYQVLRNFKINFLFLCQDSMTIFLFIRQSKNLSCHQQTLFQFATFEMYPHELVCALHCSSSNVQTQSLGHSGDLTPSTEIFCCLLSIPNSPHNLPLHSLNKKALLNMQVPTSGPQTPQAR